MRKDSGTWPHGGCSGTRDGSSSSSAAGKLWNSNPGFRVFGAQSPLTMPVAFRSALEGHMQDPTGFVQRPRMSAETGTLTGEVRRFVHTASE